MIYLMLPSPWHSVLCVRLMEREVKYSHYIGGKTLNDRLVRCKLGKEMPPIAIPLVI